MADTITKRGNKYKLSYREKGFAPVYATFDTEAEAKAEAEKIRARRKLALTEPDRKAQRITLTTLLDEYEKTVTPGKKGAKRERTRIAAWKKHRLSSRYLHLVTSADVAEYLVERRNAGVSDATIRLDLMLLSTVYKFAIKVKGYRVEHPVSGMMDALKIGKSKERDRRLRPGEADYLYTALGAIAPLHRDLAEFAVETAMRQGEIFALTWNDIAGRHIRVKASKSGRQNARVPMSTRAAAILDRLRPHDAAGNDKIFKISTDRASRVFAQGCRDGRAKYETDTGKPAPTFLDDLRFHDLRHEATSRLFERGLSRAEVLTLTRHETLEMLDRFTHLDTSENSLILQKLG